MFTLVIVASVERRVPGLSTAASLGIQLGALALGVGINVVGTAAVERVSGLLILLVQSPFVLIPIAAARRFGPGAFAWRRDGDAAADWASTLAVSLSTILWNCQGFNAIGNIAGEVVDPARDIPRGLTLAAAAVTLNYVLPLLVTVPLTATSSEFDSDGWGGWDAGHFVSIALGAGPLVGDWAAACAVLSCLLNLISQIALGSRSLQAVVRARMVPDALGGLGANATRFQTPVPAIFALAAASSGAMLLSFDRLVTVELLFLLAGLVLQFAAFLRLKYTEPDAPRPFAVPGGRAGAWAAALPLFALCALVLGTNVSSADSISSAVFVAAVLALLTAVGATWARYVFKPKLLEELADSDG